MRTHFVACLATLGVTACGALKTPENGASKDPESSIIYHGDAKESQGMALTTPNGDVAGNDETSGDSREDEGYSRPLEFWQLEVYAGEAPIQKHWCRMDAGDEMGGAMPPEPGALVYRLEVPAGSGATHLLRTAPGIFTVVIKGMSSQGKELIYFGHAVTKVAPNAVSKVSIGVKRLSCNSEQGIVVSYYREDTGNEDPIAGDFDHNGIVNIDDFYVFREAFGSSIGDANYNPECDLDSDGVVGYKDFYTFRDIYRRRTPEEAPEVQL